MTRVPLAAAAVIALVSSTSVTAAGDRLQLPPEVTPALRAACESDVRRLCMGESPTIEKVRRCVERRFGELSMRCRMQIAAAGLMPGRGR